MSVTDKLEVFSLLEVNNFPMFLYESNLYLLYSRIVFPSLFPLCTNRLLQYLGLQRINIDLILTQLYNFAGIGYFWIDSFPLQIKIKQIDTLTESDAGFKVAQNTFFGAGFLLIKHNINGFNLEDNLAMHCSSSQLKYRPL